MQLTAADEAANLHLDGYRARLRFGVSRTTRQARAAVYVIAIAGGVELDRVLAWSQTAPEADADRLKAEAGEVRALLTEICRYLTTSGPAAGSRILVMLGAFRALPTVQTPCEHVRAWRYRHRPMGHLWRAPDGSEYFALEDRYVHRLAGSTESRSRPDGPDAAQDP